MPEALCSIKVYVRYIKMDLPRRGRFCKFTTNISFFPGYLSRDSRKSPRYLANERRCNYQVITSNNLQGKWRVYQTQNCHIVPRCRPIISTIPPNSLQRMATQLHPLGGAPYCKTLELTYESAQSSVYRSSQSRPRLFGWKVFPSRNIPNNFTIHAI